MNPSGDFGKRELSAALRNRFTEIWCTSITSNHSLSLSSGREYFFNFILRMLNIDLSEFFSEQIMKQIAQALCDLFTWMNVTWSHILKPLSIRDLKTIIELIKGLYREIKEISIVAAIHLIIEGQLGISHAQMIRINVLTTVRSSLQELLEQHSILKKGLNMFKTFQFEISQMELKINEISLQRNMNSALGSKENNAYVLNNQKVLSNLLRIMMGLKSDKAILLEGPPGVGKTSLILHLGSLLGKKVHRINLNEQTDLLDLLGFDVPDPDRPGKIFVF
jgi:midasin